MKVSLTCDSCGQRIERFPSQIRGGRTFCSRACQGAYKTAHPPGIDQEKVRARRRREHEKNRERYRKRNQAYYAANKEQLRDDNRRWQQEHAEYVREYQGKWRKKNPDMQAATSRAGACNRRAKWAGAPGHISRADVTALWERQPACIHCGHGRGVDHIVDFRHGGTNTPDNLQNLCRSCNELKASKLTRDGADAIRNAFATGASRASLARRYGVTPGTIWSIVTNRTWKHDSEPHGQ